MKATAIISATGEYRYSLRRTWNPKLPCLVFVCLNPSRATSAVTDPTTRKCIEIASALGFGSILIANLFAVRSPYPGDMKKAAFPIGARNDRFLRLLARSGATVVAAWGTNGDFRRRATQVTAYFPRLVCLGRTKYKFPRHPLSVRSPFALHLYP